MKTKGKAASLASNFGLVTINRHDGRPAVQLDEQDACRLLLAAPKLLAELKRVYAVLDKAINGGCIWETGALLVDAEAAQESALLAIAAAEGR